MVKSHKSSRSKSRSSSRLPTLNPKKDPTPITKLCGGLDAAKQRRECHNKLNLNPTTDSKTTGKQTGAGKGKRPKSSSDTTTSTSANHKLTGGIQRIHIADDENIARFLPLQRDDMVTPPTWELPNRKAFYQWLVENYGKYETGDAKKAASVENEVLTDNPDRIIQKLQPIQKLVRDFMQTDSPYRGLLLYFGLGVGKTLSAISITEAIHNTKGVMVLSKAALKNNFRKDIKKGGQDMMVLQNYWVFCPCTNARERELAVERLGIPVTVIEKHGGAYLIDFSVKKSNYKELSLKHRTQLETQINALIDKRFTFVSTDDPRLFQKVAAEDFDNKVVVVDEVHNLTNNMTKSVGSGATFYRIFMESKGTKFVFLTGTPIINKAYEAAHLFNILRGYIPVVEIKIKAAFGMAIDYARIKQVIQQNINVDQIVINKTSKTIKVTKNPDGYVRANPSSHNDQHGIVPVKDNVNTQNIDELQAEIEGKLKAMGYKFAVRQYRETALPEDEKEFDTLFYNPELNKLKKPELLKKRIAGLTSYYDYKDPELFPKVNNNEKPELVLCDMTPYQLDVYVEERRDEIKMDKKRMQRQRPDDEMQSSTYRMFSRFACSFAYPEDMPNPARFRQKKDQLLEQIREGIDAADSHASVKQAEFEMLENVDEENDAAIDKFVKEYLLTKLRRNKTKYLATTITDPETNKILPGPLTKYSPKYTAMLERIQKSPGLILIYSYFKKLIGLGIFALVLEATGEWQEFRLRREGGEWHLPKYMTDHPGSDAPWRSKKRYVMYSGDESQEEKNIIPMIFNSEFDRLPPNAAPIAEQLHKLFDDKEQNLHGDVIRALMTTKTGAEGLDLKHVRSVHISEPYWQPVLIEQVIGRAVRTRSHVRLPKEERNVSVYIYMASIPKHMVPTIGSVEVRQDMSKFNDGLGKKGKVVTSDETLFITSERKKVITGQLLHLIKESAFDCNLNYSQNIKQSPNIICLDYDTKDRDKYLFTPGIDDTMDIIDIQQERPVTEDYTKFMLKEQIYYHNTYPTSDGKYYIYDDEIMKRTRMPKPVGMIMILNGKKRYAFFKKADAGKK